MCRNAKAVVLEKFEEQFREDFKALNIYVVELKDSNLDSTVHVVFERKNLDQLLVFQKIQRCPVAIGQGFPVGCRRFIGLDM